MGRVMSCEPMIVPHPHPTDTLSSSTSTSSSYDEEDPVTKSHVPEPPQNRKKGYKIYVAYTAALPPRSGMCSPCGPDTTTNSHASLTGKSLIETEYFQWFRTSKEVPVGSAVSLILLKDNPKSACTPELLNSHLMLAFSEKNCCAISTVGISLLLGLVILSLASVFEILSMPHPETQRPIGWSILIGFFFLFVITGWVFCKMLFDHFKAKVFLSAVPAPTLRRRQRNIDAVMNTVSTSRHSLTGTACAPLSALQYQVPPPLNGENKKQSAPTIEKSEPPITPDEKLPNVEDTQSEPLDVENGMLS
ncbi:MAG: hypothetical protein SGILL_009032 [Bacillariaceae sp.]